MGYDKSLIYLNFALKIPVQLQINIINKMVCVMCLVPLFLIPIVNFLPLLYYYIMAKFYKLMGWEYVKPERAPVACPYNPRANKITMVGMEHDSVKTEPATDSVVGDERKKD